MKINALKAENFKGLKIVELSLDSDKPVVLVSGDNAKEIAKDLLRFTFELEDRSNGTLIFNTFAELKTPAGWLKQIPEMMEKLNTNESLALDFSEKISALILRNLKKKKMVP